MSIRLYHNPRCSKSRATLALIEEAGLQPEIVEYLKVPLDRSVLHADLVATGLPLRELLRTTESEYRALGLENPALGEEELLDAVLAHPILLNRPIAVTKKGARLCRPPEQVLEILP